ncbi:MAG: phosphatase PAP2 family protein [Salinirussus sp.]
MSRGIGVTRQLSAWLEPLEPLVALLTQFGDIWFLAVLAVSLYALGRSVPVAGWDRRKGAVIVAVLLLAVATTGALKALFGLPRPPGSARPAIALGDVYAWLATAEGPGFPSGHALGASAVYGAIVGLVDRSNRHRAGLVAGLLILTVAASRLALGVHYLVDVVAGALCGFLLAGIALRWAAHQRRTFALGILVSISWIAFDTVSAALGTAGLCTGALVSWGRVERRLTTLDPPTGLAAAMLISASLFVGLIALVVIEFGSPAVAALGGFFGMIILIALPLVVRQKRAAF